MEIHHHHISPHHITSHQITPHLTKSHHMSPHRTISPQLISYFNRQNTFDDLAQALREAAGINIGEGLKLVVVNNSPTMQYETLSPWSSTSFGFEIGLKIIPSGLSGGGKNFSLKNEDVMRKLAPHSCDVMSKRYSKKVEVPSTPPLQTGELRVETWTGQGEFPAHFGNSRRQRVGQNPGGSEVLQRDQWRQDCVFAQEQFVVKASSFPTRNARAPWKEYRLRVASDDGWWWFFCGTFFGVHRVQCDVKHYMAFDLQVQTERLLHKNPVSTKHCELWTVNTKHCEKNWTEKSAICFSDVAISNLKLSAEQDGLSGTGAGYTLVHPLSQKKKVEDQFEQIARHLEHMMWTSPEADELGHAPP